MICEKYEKLLPQERVQFIGSLCHAVQSSDEMFTIAEEIIRQAKLRGLFDNVVIVPDPIEEK